MSVITGSCYITLLCGNVMFVLPSAHDPVCVGWQSMSWTV